MKRRLTCRGWSRKWPQAREIISRRYTQINADNKITTIMDPEVRRAEINQVTERIITCVYRVSNTRGTGFLEKVYENALAIELQQNGLKIQQQHPIRVSMATILSEISLLISWLKTV